MTVSSSSSSSFVVNLIRFWDRVAIGYGHLDRIVDWFFELDSDPDTHHYFIVLVVIYGDVVRDS
jgi:hypothetical protein